MSDLINHVCFIVDESSSMRDLKNDVIKVFDKQIEMLARLSKKVDQETRVSVYLFSNDIRNIIFDKDVLRMPSLKGLYNPNGMTKLVDATIKGIEDLKQTCSLYGDHAYLVYTMTDGEDNKSLTGSSDKLKALSASLGEEWTLGTLVPDANGVTFCKKYGYPADSIMVWNVSKRGLEEATEKMNAATEQYMQGRAKGVRGTKNLFNLDTSKLKTGTVKKELSTLKPNEYELLPVSKDTPIRPFVEKWGKQYVIGSCYYLLMKPEKIQAQKQLVLIHKKNGKAYTGQNARSLLGLPDTEVKVAPNMSTDYHIYVQSTSVNRKLISGTNLLVMN